MEKLSDIASFEEIKECLPQNVDLDTFVKCTKVSCQDKTIGFIGNVQSIIDNCMIECNYRGNDC